MRSNKEPELIAFCSALVAVSTVVIVFRCWAIKKSDSTRRHGWDDGFAIAALVCKQETQLS